jgi:hypothetical protein
LILRNLECDMICISLTQRRCCCRCHVVCCDFFYHFRLSV